MSFIDRLKKEPSDTTLHALWIEMNRIRPRGIALSYGRIFLAVVLPLILFLSLYFKARKYAAAIMLPALTLLLALDQIVPKVEKITPQKYYDIVGAEADKDDLAEANAYCNPLSETTSKLISIAIAVVAFVFSVLNAIEFFEEDA